MFGKNNTEETRNQISAIMSKTPLGLYDLENNLLKTFGNQVEIAAEFGVNKTTVSRKVRSGKIFFFVFNFWGWQSHPSNPQHPTGCWRVGHC